MKGYLKSRKDENPEIQFLRVHPKIVQSFKKLVVVRSSYREMSDIYTIEIVSLSDRPLFDF